MDVNTFVTYTNRTNHQSRAKTQSGASPDGVLTLNRVQIHIDNLIKKGRLKMKQRRVFQTEQEANDFARSTGGHYYRTFDGFGKIVWVVVYERNTL